MPDRLDLAITIINDFIAEVDTNLDGEFTVELEDEDKGIPWFGWARLKFVCEERMMHRATMEQPAEYVDEQYVTVRHLFLPELSTLTIKIDLASDLYAGHGIDEPGFICRRYHTMDLAA